MSSPALKTASTGLAALLLLAAVTVRGEQCDIGPDSFDAQMSALWVYGCGCEETRAARWGGADPREIQELRLRGAPADTELTAACLRELTALTLLTVAGPREQHVSVRFQPGALLALPALTDLSLFNVNAGEPCDWLEPGLARRLTILNLNNVNASRLCFQDWRKLTKLFLPNNPGVTNIAFADLPLAGRREKLHVIVDDGVLRDVQLAERQYLELSVASRKTKPVAQLHIGLPLQLTSCGCERKYLQRALREGLVSFTRDVQCEGGVPLVDTTLPC